MDTAWSVGKIVEKWALATPDQTAVIIDEETITYRALNARANQVCRALLGLGLKKGDRIAALTLNTIESIWLYVAAAKLGLVCVPLNNRLVSRELEYQLENSGARALVFDRQFGDRIAPIANDIDVARSCLLMVDHDGSDWCVSFDAALASLAETNPGLSEPVFLDDPLAIIYTSGTTGAPKGAVVSHLQTYFKCFQVILYTDLRQDDVWLTHMPLFHSAGLFIVLTPTLCRGATLVTSRSFDPQRFLDGCERHRATVVTAATTMWTFILKAHDPARPCFASLRCAFGGGERTPRSLIDNLLSRGVNLQLGFGQTENSFMALQRPEDTEAFFGSVGQPGFFTDIWIEGADGGEAAPAEKGHIVAQGPTVMSGYWNNPEKTAETIVDGVLRTGDVGYMDAEQHLYLVDREKDMYRTGAENVYPAEVEKVLLNHPKIFSAAVIGVPDPDWGETGKAFIVLEPGETLDMAELRRFLDGKLARYKFPRHVEFVEELPLTETGKVKKVALKRREETMGGRS